MPYDFHQIASKVSNWGRWGADDQRGCLNLITPDVLRRAATTVRQGKLIRVGVDFGRNGPQVSGGRRFNPQLYMIEVGRPFNAALGDYCFSDDVVTMPLQAATQWDSLAHVEYDGKLYNGFNARSSVTLHGACKCGIEHAASPGIVSRAVFLDIARWKGVERLSPGTAITPDDLENVCKAEGVTVERGDVVLVRTGHIRRFTHDNDVAALRQEGQPGLDMDCALWLRDHDVVAVCADNTAVERTTPDHYHPERGAAVDYGKIPYPIHCLCLRDMGMYLGEIFDFEALSEDCSKDGAYTFMLCAPALPVVGGVGSPINPLVLK